MKGRITKHEWELMTDYLGIAHYDCKHCPLKKRVTQMVSGPYTTYFRMGQFASLTAKRTPRCITRKTTDNGKLQTSSISTDKD